MAYATPASTIKVYKGVPWDNSYQDTVSFVSKGTQESYFDGLLDKTFSNYTYQRKERNVIKVDCLADDLYEDNYLSFQNRSGKTFYCFIIGCEYISEKCTALTFEIDVMQTYLPGASNDYDFNTCYVIRHHADSDRVGENIAGEPLEIGEYLYENETGLNKNGSILSPLCIVIMVCDLDDEGKMTAAEGYIINGIYSGAKLFAYTVGNYSAATAKLAEFIKSPDSIVGMYMAPLCAFSGTPSGDVGASSTAERWTCSLGGLTCSGSEDFDGYTPRNKKLYTYPYNGILVTNRANGSLTLRYEFFNGGTPEFELYATAAYPPQVVLRPYNYSNDANSTWMQSLTLDNYPQCSWASSSWRNYMGSGGLVADIANGAASAIGGFASGNFLGAATGAAGSIMNIYQAAIAADVCHGSSVAGNINCSAQEQNFSAYRIHITAEYAEMIDSFFDKYGYAQNRIMKPNTRARRCWTYIQTGGCTLLPRSGGCPPADAMSKICSIMDKGITFWQPGVTVGDYSQDNSI